MTFPKSGGPEWADSQATPNLTVNAALRRLDAGVQRWVVVDRDLGSPPGSCADGANYLIASPDSGAWDTLAGQLATAKGANASNGWDYTVVAVEGYQLYLQDENQEIVYDGSGWKFSGSLAVTTQSGTTYTAALTDSNGFIQFTNGSPVTFTIPPNASVAIPVGTRISFEQNGAGVVTVDPDSGVTVNSRDGALDTAGQYAVATLIKVATNVWTLAGDVTT